MAASNPVAVTVLGGYLGSGKTTLVNQVLRHAGDRRIAVLVNDFGELPIDADLVEAEGNDLISIAGGCVCCSFGSDLISALEQLSRSRAGITHVLLEASGVALPSSIASSVALVPGYRVAGIVVLCDATNALERSADRYLADTILAQLEGADRIVLGKTDLVEVERRDRIVDWLTKLTGRTPILRPGDRDFPLTSLLDADDAGAPDPHGPMEHDPSIYRTTRIALPDRVRAGDLARALARIEPELLRAKGILRDPSGNRVQLHVVGRHWSVEACRESAVESGHLLTISLRSGPDRQSLRNLADQYVCPRD
jgi:G3E family GTPase